MVLVALTLSVFMAGQGLEVTTGDGLALTFDQRGRIAAVRLDGRALPLIAPAWPFEAADAGAAIAGAKNLLPNPSFEEDADGDGVPDGWSYGKYWAWDRTVAHTGRASLRVSVPGTEDRITGELHAPRYPAKPGEHWVFSFWAKTKNSAGQWQSHMYILQLDENGRWAAPQIPIPTRKGTNDWFSVRRAFVVAPGTKYVSFYANIYQGHGTCWYDDVSLKRIDPAPKPCVGRARRDGDNAVRWRGRSADGTVEIQARYRGTEDRIVVEGTVRARKLDQEHAAVIEHILPIDLRGWQWHHDMYTSQRIDADGQYSNYSDFGGHPMARYPICSVTRGSTGLGLAFPMDLPLVVKLEARAAKGLAWHWEVGLSPLTKKFPSSANFRFDITRTQPAEGMRSAMLRYYSLYPQFFVQRLRIHGCWWLGYDPKLEHPEDFALQFHELDGGPSVWDYDDRHGIGTYKYTEPWGAWIGFRFKNPENKGLYQAKSYDEAVALLKEALRQPPDLMGIEPHTFGTLPLRTWADIITRCAILDADGRYYISFGYGNQNFALNPDPDLPEPNRWTVSWQYEYLEAATRARRAGHEIEGVYLDSVTPWWAARENYRREHWAYADYPLVFSWWNDGRVCQVQWTEQMQFMAKMAKELHKRGKTVIANIFPPAHLWAAPYVDMFGAGEGATERYWRDFPWERAIAYRKPISILDYELLRTNVPQEKKVAKMHRLLACAIFPGGSPFDRKHAEPVRPLYRRFIPIFRALAQAGWHPLRHAVVEPAEIWLERFGPRDGLLYFTLHNPTDKAADASVVLQQAWSRYANADGHELVTGASVRMRGGRFSVHIPPAQTRVVALSAR